MMAIVGKGIMVWFSDTDTETELKYFYKHIPSTKRNIGIDMYFKTGEFETIGEL